MDGPQHRLLTAASAAVIGLLFTTSAQGADRRISRAFVPQGGPVLAGSTVLWAEATARRGFRVMMAAPGDSPAPLATFNPMPGRDSIEPSLAASGSRWVLVATSTANTGTSDATSYTQAFTARLGEPLEPVAAEMPGSGGGFQSAFASGDRIAYPVHGCDDMPTATFAVRTVGSDGQAACGRGTAYSVAGRYAAFETTALAAGEDDDVVVRDLDGQQDLFRFHRSAIPDQSSFGVNQTAVRDDGVLALTSLSNRARRFRVFVADRSDPRPRQLPLIARPYQSIRWTGRDLLVLRSNEFNFGSKDDGVLEVVDAEGRPRHVIARSVSDRFDDPMFDTNGTDVVYVTRSCKGVVLRVRPVAAAAGRAGAPVCPLGLTQRPHVIGDRNHVQVVAHVSCRGFLRRCAAAGATLAIRTSGRWKKISAGARSRAQTVIFSLTPAGVRAVRHVRGRHGVQVRVRARVADLLGGRTAMQDRSVVVRLHPRA